MKAIARKIVLSGVLLFTSSVTLGESLCLNEVGEAAYKAAKENLKDQDSAELSSRIKSAVDSVSLIGASTDYEFYEASLSGKKFSDGMIVGPLQLEVKVFAFSGTCDIDVTKTTVKQVFR